MGDFVWEGYSLSSDYHREVGEIKPNSYKRLNGGKEIVYSIPKGNNN